MKMTLRIAALAGVLTAAILTSPQATATVVDLTTNSTYVLPTIWGNAIFTTDFTQPTGTGVFDPFLSIQAKGVEQGYNTSKGVFDTKREPQWNHEIRLSDLAQSVVTIQGTQYYSFLIDINEPNGGNMSQISLDMLQIYTSNKAGQTTANAASLGAKRFDIDLPSDSYILYDDANHGSGQSDIAFFVPTSAFLTGSNPASPDDYVYMYQKFGMHVSADFEGATSGGFEETRIGVGIQPIPEVSTILPLAGVLGAVVGVKHFRRRRTAIVVA